MLMQTTTIQVKVKFIPETEEVMLARKSRVFGGMLHFGESLPSIRIAVASDLNSSNLQTRACAAIVAIIDQTTMRIGGAEYAAANKTYGASSMLKSHVLVTANDISFDFIGKHHKSHCKTVTGTALIEAIKFFMSLEGDKLFPVTETQVRAYLSQFGATPKQFRTYHASRLANELLTEMGKAADEKTARKNIISAVKTVSQLLGNTPAMARGSYINPAVLAAYAANI